MARIFLKVSINETSVEKLARDRVSQRSLVCQFIVMRLLKDLCGRQFDERQAMGHKDLRLQEVLIRVCYNPPEVRPR
jgi:hypothetical protein